MVFGIDVSPAFEQLVINSPEPGVHEQEQPVRKTNNNETYLNKKVFNLSSIRVFVIDFSEFMLVSVVLALAKLFCYWCLSQP